MNRKVIVVALAVFAALPVFAINVGELQPGGGTVASRGGALAPITIISFARPALANGTVDRATLIWTGAPAAGCDNAFRIKFFRPGDSGLTMLAERGPFKAVNGVNNVTLSPGISLLAGDLIGVAQLLPATCGGVVNRRSDANEVWGAVPRDPSSGSGIVDDIEYEFGLVPSVRASSETNPIHGYLPVVGSTAGGFGSLFRTALQMTNRGGQTISGRLVFHRAGTSGVSTDPEYIYELTPNQTLSLEDIVAAAGTTGIGSMDVIPANGTYPPDISARIYNDQGSAGTSGFSTELRTPYQAMHRFDRGSLVIPTDLQNFRMNVGVRTLGDGARLNIIQYDASGVSSTIFVSRDYPANYFEQATASQFLANNPVAPGGYIVVQVESGSAFVYATVTDNRTNDSAIRYPLKY
jgi:hypothetical protein